MPLWPHQTWAIDDTERRLASGVQRLCVTAPTGAGKGVLIEKAIENARSATLYTDRRALLTQTAERLDAAGFDYGIRAAGCEPNHLAPIQLCMVQTEDSRVLRNEWRDHHRCERVIVDEAHRPGGGSMAELRNRHLDDGSAIIGYTATPVGIGDYYYELLTAARVSDCIKCGALVPALTFAPSEPDLDELNVKRTSDGEFEVKKLADFYKRPAVFGNIIENWQRLNPDRKPTVLFAPDVEGSRWICDQLNAQGIPAGHIDAERIQLGDEVLENTDENRERLRDALYWGEIEIVCNRFILREGIDWPWVECAILATAFGSVTTYIQSVGRVLRAALGKDHAIVIDHGGNFHRHGSPNSDRYWDLRQSTYQASTEREKRMKNHEAEDHITEPSTCPKCSRIQLELGKVCPHCGYISKGRSRMVIQSDGTLCEVTEPEYKPHRRAKSHNEKMKQFWVKSYFSSKNKGRTFGQAFGWFAQNNYGLRPSPDWPYMPKYASDEALPVNQVPVDRLNGYPGQSNSEGLFGGAA